MFQFQMWVTKAIQVDSKHRENQAPDKLSREM